MFSKLKERFINLSPTSKGFVIIIVLLIIGILIRWKEIISDVVRGFNYFSK